MKNIYVISLGCDKNRVDTETMLFELNARGYGFCARAEDADILIVNTCAFLESARAEAIESILDCALLKQDKCEKLIVTGCLPQRFLRELKDDLPEVDAFLGINGYGALPDIIDGLYSSGKRSLSLVESPACGKRLLTTDPHYAYVRIADGCDNRCSYCLIPSIRGRYRSRSIEDIALECASLASSGVKELIFVAQDTTRYGFDLYKSYRLVDLINECAKIEGIEQIRLLYCYPELVTDQLIELFASQPKLCRYIDIPLQHISDRVLSAMNRRSTKAQIQHLITKLRKCVPDIAIRSTFITGFPCETEEDVAQLEEFLQEYKLTHAGFFAYSREEGTPACSFEGQIGEEEKAARVSRLANVQANVSLLLNRERIGRVLRVRYEGIDYDKNLFYGRSEYQAPDVDGKIFFSAKSVNIGEFYDIMITACDYYDLQGRIHNEHTK